MPTSAASKNIDYERPPLVEVVGGIHFRPLRPFRNAHLGLFWDYLGREAWPLVNDAPFLPPIWEALDESTKSWGRVNLRISQEVETRLQIRNADATRMVQLQNGTLYLNWFGQGSGYPRYPKIRAEFVQLLETFGDFLRRFELGEFVPSHWEIIYVNMIPKGTVWSEPKDWRFCKLLGWDANLEGIASPETFNGAWRFALPEARGRLYVEWECIKWRRTSAQNTGPTEHAGDVEEDAIRLQLTARGPLERHETQEQNVQAALHGLDFGRQAIVRSFHAMMSDEANRYWGFKS